MNGDDPLAYLRGEFPQAGASAAPGAPSKREGILVVVEVLGNDLTATSKEAVRQACSLAAGLGTYVSGYLAPGAADAAGVRKLPVGKLFRSAPADSFEATLKRVASFMKESEFQAVLMGESPWALAFAPALSESLGAGLAGGVEALEVDSSSGDLLATSTAYGGKLKRVWRLSAPRPHLFILSTAAAGSLELLSGDVPVEDV